MDRQKLIDTDNRAAVTLREGREGEDNEGKGVKYTATEGRSTQMSRYKVVHLKFT